MVYTPLERIPDMASKGNPILTLRISPDMKAYMVESIDARNATTVNVPWTIASFVEEAIRQALLKMDRSRGRALRTWSAKRDRRGQEECL